MWPCGLCRAITPRTCNCTAPELNAYRKGYRDGLTDEARRNAEKSDERVAALVGGSN